jgi:NADPH:quinone reductase-like Zn-dependent oxidoreductase
LTVEERSDPIPGPTEIVVSMRAAALNYRDLLVVHGRGDRKPPESRVLNSDGVGVVTGIGAKVTRWRLGDRVAGIFLPNWIDGS